MCFTVLVLLKNGDSEILLKSGVKKDGLKCGLMFILPLRHIVYSFCSECSLFYLFSLFCLILRITYGVSSRGFGALFIRFGSNDLDFCVLGVDYFLRSLTKRYIFVN